MTTQGVAITTFSSKTNEYYTPPRYVEMARQVMGGIDLDPASCVKAQEIVRARCYYTIADDGLTQPWHGNIFLNPPYGKIANRSSQSVWAQAALTHWFSGKIDEGIVLLRAAVGYKWFEELWDVFPSVCFARERIAFIRADGSVGGKSKQGAVFFYVGEDTSAFSTVFSSIGRVFVNEWV